MTAPLRTRSPESATPIFAPSAAPRPFNPQRFAPSAAPATAPTRADTQIRPRRQPERRVRPPQAPPTLRLVDPAAERQRRRAAMLTGALVMAICAGLFSIVGLRVMLAQGQVEIDRLETTVDSQRATQQRLRLTVAELEAPARIVKDARSRLGMINPGVVTSLAPASAPGR